MALDALNNAIIGVRALMCALEALKAWIACDTQRDAVFWTELFEFGKNTCRDAGDGFGVEAVHHPLNELDFILEAEVNKVGIHQNAVGRSQGGIVLKEHG